MSELNLERIARLSNRALGILKTPNPHPAVAAVAPRVTEVCTAFLATDTVVHKAEAKANREAKEAKTAIGRLTKEYDASRSAVKSNAPDEPVGSAASRFATSDDLLKAAEDLEDVLEDHKDEPWAASILTVFSPLLDEASKEWSDSVEANAELQKAKAARRDAGGAVESALVDFRRIIRVVYGATSKEYHSIKSRVKKGEEDVDEEKEEEETEPITDRRVDEGAKPKENQP